MCKYSHLAREFIEVQIVKYLMEVSAMLYGCTYCVFTLYGRYNVCACGTMRQTYKFSVKYSTLKTHTGITRK